ncbi:MAG: DUF120 domain-containing protein [Candidatus Bathycorpusculaceae bacterium]
MRISGKVSSGRGEGEKFIELPWVKEQIEAKLGFAPHPGTLNIRLSNETIKLKKLLKKAKSIVICPADGFCLGRCFKAYLASDVECAVVIPEVADYPEDLLEVIAPANLREKLQLRDGDVVEIKIVT